MIESARSPLESRFRALTILLLAVAAGALLIRITAIAQPLGIDQSLWASAVFGMDHGLRLYRDVWEQRPPGIYWIYLAAFRWLGWHPSTVAWLDLAAATATTALVYGIARPMACRLTAALAAAMYAVLTMPSWLYGHGGFLERAVSETFIVVCVCGAAWCAVRWRQRPSFVLAAGLGLCAGTTLIFKPNAGLYFPALLCWLWFYARHTGDRSTLWRALATASCAAALLPAAALIWLWNLDLLSHAKTAVVDFNRYYVGEGFDVTAYALTFSKAVWLRMKTEPLWTAGGVGAVAAVWTLVRNRQLPPLAGLVIIWGAAAVCVIVANGARLFNSYFIQAMPPLALLGAWFIVTAMRGRAAWRVAGWATLLIMGVLLVQRDYLGRVLGQARTDLAALTGDVDQMTYLEGFGRYDQQSGYSARANAELAAYLRAHTEPDDQIFLFGINGAGVYFDAERLPAHRFLRVNFFVDTEFPDPAFRLDAVVRDLGERRPRYLIFERLHRSSVPSMQQFVDALPEHPPVRALLRGYEREAVVEDFTLYRLVE